MKIQANNAINQLTGKMLRGEIRYIDWVVRAQRIAHRYNLIINW